MSIIPQERRVLHDSFTEVSQIATFLKATGEQAQESNRGLMTKEEPKRGKKKKQSGNKLFHADGLELKDLVGSVVVIGFLVVFLVAAFRLPPDRLFDLLQIAANPLALVVIYLFRKPSTSAEDIRRENDNDHRDN